MKDKLLAEVQEKTDLLVVYKETSRVTGDGVVTSLMTEDIYGIKNIEDYQKAK